MKKTEFTNLIERYLDGRATKEEQDALLNYYDESQKDQLTWSDMDMGEQEEVGKTVLNKIYNEINAKESGNRKMLFSWISIAASLTILLGLGSYLFVNRNVNKKGYGQIFAGIKPGGNKAVLTLADGSKVILNDAGNGKIAQQAGITITKTTDGQLVYTISKDRTPGSRTTVLSDFNTIETPSGGQYQINLPDGTKVWLNAGSLLKYPTQFTGNERKVELKGEGYFEVSKDKTKPFKVVTDKQEVQVLGTHFNINAYDDEDAVKTTLLEGSVKVSLRSPNSQLSDLNSKLLRPGQQSVLESQMFRVNEVDVEEVIAWKNGYFIFSNEDMKSAMKKLSRWYDVDFTYSGNFDNIYFGGSFPRSGNLTETLKILESTNKFKCKIEGRRIKIIN